MLFHFNMKSNNTKTGVATVVFCLLAGKKGNSIHFLRLLASLGKFSHSKMYFQECYFCLVIEILGQRWTKAFFE